MRLKPCSRLTRRARARSSVGLRAGVSSTKILASDSWLVAPVIRTQSSSEMRPLRRLLSGTPPIEASMRVMTCSEGISMLKIAPGAQAAGELVEVGEPRRQAPQLVGIVVPVIDLIDDPGEQLADRHRAVALAEAPFGNIEHALLGAVNQLARGLAVVVEHGGGDVGAGADQLPQQRALAHDVRVGAHVGGRGGVARNRAQVGESAGRLEPAGALQMLGHRHYVAGFAFPGERADGGENQLVIGTVEVFLR